MLVSCKDEVIDYRNDIGVNVLKDKSALLASESPKEIKITSKSNKVFYEVNILNIDDETGKMQVKVTPIYKKKVQESFEMTIDGFQKSTKQNEENSTPEEKPKKYSLSEITDKIYSIDFQYKQLSVVSNFIYTRFTSALVWGEVVIFNMSAGPMKLRTFWSEYSDIKVQFNLREQNDEKGTCILDVKFTKGNETIIKTETITGFKLPEPPKPPEPKDPWDRFFPKENE
ncbi:lipoprotein 17-related variable surface protein [Metamycoplasma hyosynoviae]|uniref:lipoprotein 17-related variable surface protein n=1 Tax=Metamycoplasma hyosynoviae TaxID=29559 RepID=UPI00249C4E5C|nr:lipoprotein 17-related variable surface protein [Metamycoplasma hyosynoviae]MDI3064201.1 lipoprotein 17-related variable surface protein [Metamycoplasma hyosynoviae]